MQLGLFLFSVLIIVVTVRLSGSFAGRSVSLVLHVLSIPHPTPLYSGVKLPLRHHPPNSPGSHQKSDPRFPRSRRLVHKHLARIKSQRTDICEYGKCVELGVGDMVCCKRSDQRRVYVFDPVDASQQPVRRWCSYPFELARCDGC